MNYGNIFTLNDTLFFIYRVNGENQYDVIKEDNIEQITPMKVEPNTYTLLYTPYNHSYIVLNQLKVSQEITLQLNDGTTSTGVIESINYKEDSLTYKVGDEIKPIHFHFKGMPSDIVNIEKIYKEHDFEKDTIVEEEKSTEEEEGEVFYYYSLEQQMNDLKHDLETPDIMKNKKELYRLNKLVTRFVELNIKYYPESVYKPLPTDPVGDFIEGPNPLYTYTTDKLAIEQFSERFKGNIYQDTYLSKSIVYYHPHVEELIPTPFKLIYNLEKPNIKDKKKHIIQNTIYIQNEALPHYLVKLADPETLNISGIMLGSYHDLLHHINDAPSSSILNKSVNKPLQHDYEETTDIPNNDCKIFTDIKRHTKNISHIKPTLTSIIQCYCKDRYLNMNAFMKKISLFGVSELSNHDYNIFMKIMKKNVKLYINEIKKEHTHLPQINKKNPQQMIPYVLPYMENNYYSISEILSMMDEQLVLFKIAQKNINNTEVDIPFMESGDIIHKVYSDEVTLTSDKYPYMDVLESGEPILLNDIGKAKIVPSSKLLYSEMNKKYNVNTREFNNWIIKEDDDKEQGDKVKIATFISKYSLRDGNIAYVLSTQKKYIRKDSKWEPIDVLKDPTLELNTSASLNNAIVNNDINKISLSDDAFDILKGKIHVKKTIVNNVNKKHNIRKIQYGSLAKVPDTPSPHQELFHKILAEPDLSKKMEHLTHFFAIYTVKTEDQRWLYCKTSGKPLVPMFYNDLVQSYHIGEYDKKIEELCLLQGGNEGNMYVDKYSGYIIKHINFSDEEGFTKDGHKNTFREIIKKADVIEINSEDKLIYDNIDSICELIHISVTPHDITEMLHLFNNSMIILRDAPIYNRSKKMSTLYTLLCSMYIYILVYIDAEPGFYNNCKPSFDGYPLHSNNNNGLEYFCCIFNHIIKKSKTSPWDVPPKSKFEGKDAKIIMKNVILKNDAILTKLKEKKEKDKNKSMVETNKWDLFLPRMKTMVPISKSFTYHHQVSNIQYIINEYVHSQKLLLKGHGNIPEHKNYFYMKDNTLKDIKQRLTNVPTPPQIFNPPLLYSDKDTKSYLYKFTYERSDETKLKLYRHNNKVADESNDTLLTHISENPGSILKYDTLEGVRLDKPTPPSIELNYMPDIRTDPEHYTFIRSIPFKHQFNSYDNLYKIQIVQNILQEMLYIFPNRNIAFRPNEDYMPWDILNRHQESLEKDMKKSYGPLYDMVPQIDLQEYKNTFEAIPHIVGINHTIRLGMYVNILNDIYVKYEIKDKGYATTIKKYYEKMITELDNSYEKVSRNKSVSRELEKQEFTDKLKNMSVNERKTSMELKTHKLGDWSIGLEQSVYKYNKHDMEKQLTMNKDEDDRPLFDPDSYDPEEEEDYAISEEENDESE